MNGKNAIWYGIGADTSGLEKAKVDARKVWQQMESDASKAGSNIDKIWKKAGQAVGAYLSVNALNQFISNMVKIRGEFQQLEIAFATMLRSGEKSKKLMSDLTQFAAETPFGLQSAASGAKQLLAYGSAAETVVDELRMLGDVAAGTGQTINDIVYLYGTLRTQGRAYLMDIRQFAGRGIPIYDELAKVLGTTKDKVNDFVSAGKVGFKEIEQAFKNMTAEGGLYGGLMDAQSKSVTGRIEQLRDAIDMMFNKIGESNEGVVYSVISGATSIVENYEKVGKILAELIAAYGTYKTALIAINVINKQRIAFNALVQEQMIIEQTLRKGATADMVREAAAAKALQIARGNLLNMMKSMVNPHVLAAAAVAALGLGIYKLATYQTEAEKAQKRLNDAISESEKASLGEIRNLAKLKGELSATTKGTKEYNDIKEKIVKNYGKYNSGLEAEIEKVGLLDSTYKSLTESIANAFGARQYLKFKEEQTNYLDDVTSKNLGKIQDRLLKELGEESGAEYYALIRDAILQGEELSEEVIQVINNVQKKGTIAADARIDSYIQKIRNAQKTTDEFDAKARQKFGINGSSGNDSDEKGPDPFITFDKQVEESRSKIAKFKDDLKKLRSGIATKDLAPGEQFDFAKAIEDANKSLKEEQDKLNTLLGADPKKAKADADAENKRRALIEKQELERIREAEDLAMRESQAYIDSLDEGAERERKQRELNHKKELQDIERMQQDLLRKRVEDARALFEADPKNKGKIFDPTGIALSEEELSVFARMMGYADKEFDNEAKKVLDKYQDYYAKRLAAEEKFAEDRKRLKDAGASQEALDELDYQRRETLKAIDDEYAMREDSFQAWVDQVADVALDKLRQLLAEARAELERMGKENPQNPELAAQRAKVERLNSAIYKAQAENNLSPGKRTLKEWKDLHDVLSSVEKEFGEIGDAVGGTAGELIKKVGGISSTTLSVINSITQLSNWSSISMQRTAEGASKAMIAVEKASVILTLVSLAIQLMQKLNELIPTAHDQYKKFAEKTSEINKMTDAVREYELAVLAARHAEDNWFGSDGLASLRQAREMGEKSIEAYREKLLEEQATYQNESGGGWLTDNILGVGQSLLNYFFGNNYSEGTTAAANNLRIETQAASKGFWGTGIGAKDQKTEDLATWTKKNLGIDLFDSDGFLNLEAAKIILSDYNHKLVGESKATLESLVELQEKYEEYITSLREYVSTLYEPLVDNFVDSLWDWFDTGKDALDSFKEYASDTFRDIVSDMMRTLVLESIFDGFKDDIADIYADYASGELTEAELADKISKRTANLVSDAETNLPALQNVMEIITGSLEDIAGIDLSMGGSSREAAAKGIATASQDSVNETNGRLTVMQGHSYDIRENTNILVEQSKRIQEQWQAFVVHNAKQLQHLAQIENYTSYLPKMASQLESIATHGVISKQ